MRAAVENGWFNYSVKHEGFTPFMYVDRLNLVTSGIGNLLDNGPRDGFVVNATVMAPALDLPWRSRAAGWTTKNPLAGGLVSRQEIVDAWTLVKLHEVDHPGFNENGGFKYAGMTNITLDMDGIKQLFTNKTKSVNKALAGRYPGYESWPADAQMALMSMSWAMGDAFWPVLRPRPKEPAGPTNVPFFQAFKDACDRLDFDGAATHCIFTGGGNVNDTSSRNHDNTLMFHNAAVVQKAGADPDLLWFPSAANPSSSGGIIPSFVAPVASKVAANAVPIVGGALGVGLLGFGFFKWWESRK